MKRLLFGLISVSLALAAIVSIIGQRRANQLQAAEDSSVREAPRRLHAGTQGIGRQVANLSFTDSDGQSHQLSHLTKAGPVVIALTGTGCPLCLKYAPTLAAIEDRYRKQGVTFVFVNPNQTEQGARSEQAIADHGFDGAYINDGNKQLCSALQAETTTEVFVLDEARTLLYRGAVDDQYGLGYALEQPSRNYLTDALDAVLTNRDVPIPATSSPGCEMIYDQPTTADDTSVTYHRQVARIIQANCVECHRAGGIAPMPFETYAQVKDYAGMIKRVVHDGTMPPWFAAAPTDNSRKPWKEAVHLNDSVHWANDRSLSDRDKQDLLPPAYADQADQWRKATRPTPHRTEYSLMAGSSASRTKCLSLPSRCASRRLEPCRTGTSKSPMICRKTCGCRRWRFARPSQASFIM